MAVDRQQQMLRLYIERVTALQAERGRALELRDMKEIARELGMSEDDIAAADGAARAHLDRGLRHNFHKRWGDAIAELREAAALDPMNIEVLSTLALSHKERWLALGDPEDRQQAAELARQSMALDPAHDPSYVLLNELDKPRVDQASVRVSPRRTMAAWISLAIALFLVLVVLPLTFVIQRNERRQKNPPSPAAVQQRASGSAVRGRELPVIWEGNRGEGIDLRFHAAGSDGRDLVIENVGSEDVSAIMLRLDGPAAGSPVSIDALADLDGSLESEESMVLRRVLRGPGDVTVVVLSASDDD